MTNEQKETPAMKRCGETEAFWDAAAEGRLLLKACEDCGRTHFYPRTICPLCGSERTYWQEAAGTGTIYSCSVARRSQPYCLAYVDLDEGPRILTNLVEADLETISIGARVRVLFRAGADGRMEPVFAPTGNAPDQEINHA